jgi:hypothetical protein
MEPRTVVDEFTVYVAWNTNATTNPRILQMNFQGYQNSACHGMVLIDQVHDIADPKLQVTVTSNRGLDYSHHRHGMGYN